MGKKFESWSTSSEPPTFPYANPNPGEFGHCLINGWVVVQVFGWTGQRHDLHDKGVWAVVRTSQLIFHTKNLKSGFHVFLINKRISLEEKTG